MHSKGSGDECRSAGGQMNFENDCGSVSNGGDNGILSGAIRRGSLLAAAVLI